MRRIARLATRLSAAAGILLAIGFGATQALASPSGAVSARTCNINFCEDFCGAGWPVSCHHLTGECICG